MRLSRTIAAALLFVAATYAAASGDYFEIQVVDEQTGRGVPLIELKTVNAIRYYTDSAGRIAFNEPGLMGREVFFRIRGHGYEYPADGFGYRGVRLTPKPGERAEIKIKRINIAERLYRLTGAGIYRDTVLLGHAAPLAQPVLNANVVGQDSVVTAVYRDKLYWFWGDTSRAAYPLGNFQVTGATTPLPGPGGLNPDVGVNYAYFDNGEGFTKEMAALPGPGPNWIDGLVVLPDESGRERLYAAFAKVNQDMSARRRGLLVFNDDQAQFELVADYALDYPVQPGGHPFVHGDGDERYVYYTRPFANIRVPANAAALSDLARFEAFTPLKAGTKADDLALDRDTDGKLRWDWKHNASPIKPADVEKLVEAGKLKPEECRQRLVAAIDGQPVIVHGGSIYWNDYRDCWIMIAQQAWGTSMIGELWYTEASSPIGPWSPGVKIVTHDQYSFYNPKQHPEMDQAGGQLIYFEGTYTHTFSGNPDQTPRYDYNQIMYRLDLSDERLAPARLGRR